MTRTSIPCESLTEMLRCERKSDLEYQLRLHDFWGGSMWAEMLGGMACAAVASAGGRELRSLHASFGTPAPAGAPLDVSVAVLEESGSLSRRELRVSGDTVHCSAVAALSPVAPGPAYQDDPLDASLPAPEGLPSTAETAAEEGWSDYALGPVEFRRVGPLFPDASAGDSLVQCQWVRPRQALADDPTTRAAAAIFLCDFYVHWAFERRIGRAFDPSRFRCIDQAIWLHAPRAWDDWWLLEASSEAARAGIATGRRRLFTRDGVLVASACQTAEVASR